MIGLRHATIIAGWLDAQFAFRNLAQAFNTVLHIWPSLSRGYQTVSITIHYCYYLMAPGK